MKKGNFVALLSLIVLAGQANAQSAAAAKRKINQSASSTSISTAMPVAEEKPIVSFNLETKVYPAQKNASEVLPQVIYTPEAKFDLGARHKFYVTITDIEQNLQSEQVTEENGDETTTKLKSFIMGDTRLRYRYILTSPKLKSHKAQFNVSYLAPTGESTQKKKVDGALDLRFDYIQNFKAGDLSSSVMLMPYIRKFFVQNAVWETGSPVTDFAMGSFLVINFDYGKVFMENTLDARVLFPVQDPEATATGDQATVKSVALLETYLGYNFTDSFSAFLYFVNANNFINTTGYDFNIADGDTALYGAGFRVNF